MTYVQEVILPFAPRPWQIPLLDDPAPRIVAVVHRRAGKSTALMWRGIRRCILEPKPLPRVVHILPYGIMWKRTGLWDQVMRAATAIPGAEIMKADLAIRLPNGGTFQCGGADNPDSWRGGYADETTIDEYDDTPPSLVPLVIEPMLADRNGMLVRSGTPKGRGLLQAAYDRAKTTPGYSSYLLDYTKTGALSHDAIERLRQEMSEEEFAQEMCCSFAAPNSGSYYGKLMNEAETEGRICQVPYDPAMRVTTTWDLGIDDSTAVWFIQQSRSGQWRVIDYLEGSGVGLDFYARALAAKRYTYDRHILPHDAEVRDLGSGRSRTETLRALGVSPVRIIPAQSVADGINAVRMILPKCWFDAEKCAAGIKALRNYRREWNEAGQTWRSNPVHDFASHGCFVGDTNVLTRYGTCRIDCLPETGEVLTPCGWRDYINPHITRRDAQLAEVVFSGGYTVRCTPDHLFLTAAGWISANALLKGTMIQSTLTRSPATSMATYIKYGQVSAIFRRVGRDFIAMLGSGLLERFRRAVISITEMATQSTMPCPISNVSLRPSTCPKAGVWPRLTRFEPVSISPMQQEPKQPSGIGPKKAACGTAGWHYGLKAGESAHGKPSRVYFAASRLMRWFERVAIPGNIARSPVRPLVIERVTIMAETADVWDITVPSDRCFSLANGAVVHNSDAFRYAAMGLREARETERVVPRMPVMATSWMGA